MNDEDSSSALQHARMCATEEMEERLRPSVVFRPEVYPDGNKWCALYGENLQEGVAGFGDSPDEAMRAFDVAWCTELPTQEDKADD